MLCPDVYLTAVSEANDTAREMLRYQANRFRFGNVPARTSQHHRIDEALSGTGSNTR